MGCSSSKQGVVPVYDDPATVPPGGNKAEPAVAPTDNSGHGHKSTRHLLQQSPSSKRFIDRKDNQSFFDKSRSTKGFASQKAGHKSTRRVSAFSDRVPVRMDPPPLEEEGGKSGNKSRFARSIKVVTDAVFGPPPEWILRQTTPIK
ncbi:hypothetical protein TSOC_014879, partial [Tetrabaena socialis]